jgi:thymidylate kinase
LKAQRLILSYSGIDGSGKTSIIDGVTDAINKEGVNTRYIWLRYNHYLTKLLLVFCRIVGLTKYHKVDGQIVGYHNFYKSKIVSYLFIALTYIDTLIVTVLLVYLPSIFSKATIICDRWVLDILIDLEIDTKLVLQNTFVSQLFFALVPDNAACFIIYRDYESVLHARDEHKIDKNFKDRYGLYYSREHDGFQVINNTKDLNNAITDAIEMVKIR